MKEEVQKIVAEAVDILYNKNQKISNFAIIVFKTETLSNSANPVGADYST